MSTPRKRLVPKEISPPPAPVDGDDDIMEVPEARGSDDEQEVNTM